MIEYTLTEWRSFPPEAKGLWTSTAFMGKRTLALEYPGTPMTEGIGFFINPTGDELSSLAQEILDSIDREKVRGFHPWQFTGAAIIDDHSLLTATTRQDSKLDVEARFFTDKRPRYREQIDELTIRRVCRYNKEALVERLGRIFGVMSMHPRKRPAR